MPRLAIEDERSLNEAKADYTTEDENQEADTGPNTESNTDPNTEA